MPLHKCKDNDYVYYVHMMNYHIYIQGTGLWTGLITDRISVGQQILRDEDVELYCSEGHVYG